MENHTLGQKGFTPYPSNRKTNITRAKANRSISHHFVTRCWGKTNNNNNKQWYKYDRYAECRHSFTCFY